MPGHRPGVAEAEIDVVVPVSAAKVGASRLSTTTGKPPGHLAIHCMGRPPRSEWRERSNRLREPGWACTNAARSRSMSSDTRLTRNAAHRPSMAGTRSWQTVPPQASPIGQAGCPKARDRCRPGPNATLSQASGVAALHRHPRSIRAKSRTHLVLPACDRLHFGTHRERRTRVAPSVN